MFSVSKTLSLVISSLLLLTAMSLSYVAKAQIGFNTKNDTLSQNVLIHPVIETAEDELIFSREHTYKENLGLGDQLARDFVVATSNNEGLIQLFENDGKANKDYTGWRKHVLAPITGTVVLTNHPDTTNKPGVMNRDAEPGRIYIEDDEGATVTLVHVREIKVKEGQEVKAGESVAKVGNNGNSTGPHVHVGAWKDETPLQIQVDLYADERERYGKEEEKDSK